MTYSRLFIWVEGDDDERFVRNIETLFQRSYSRIDIVQYAMKSLKWRRNFLQSIISQNADYIFLRDIDGVSCVTERKRRISSEISSIDLNKLFIVVKEIEGWYLAGLDADARSKLKILKSFDVNQIMKEQFDQLMPKQFDSRVDFMMEILKHFRIDECKRSSSSFDYFATTCGL